MLAFASTYEESNCEMSNGCKFTFLASDSLPEVTGPASASFDQTTGEYKIEITGSGFIDSASDIDFLLAGVEQTILSATQD